MTVKRSPVPIVVVLYHREEGTRKMFQQLAMVTEGYDLIIVNNGFDDPGFIKGLKLAHYIENKENTGAIRGINQGLELAEGKYVAVLHSDILIYDEGWLDHIIEFMERRPDVGLVGIQGAHTITEEGRFDFETNVVHHRGWCTSSLRSTWRSAEVAMVDGVCWVMRNEGFKLEEKYGLMHCYDLDLSLQFIDAGYRVYVMIADWLHLIQKPGGNVELELSSRGRSDYLERVGGDDTRYFDLVTGQFREKWGHLLPITRGFRDEAYGVLRAGELRQDLELIESHIQNLQRYICGLESEITLRERQITESVAYIEQLRKDSHDQRAEVVRMSQLVAQLQPRLQPEKSE